MLSLPVSTLASRTCVPVSLASLFRLSVPLSPCSHPTQHRPSLYNDRPALSARPSASLYLPPSAAIAFTTISFYIVTFSACETTRPNPGPSFPSRRNGRGKKKKVKTADSKNCALHSSSRPRLHSYIDVSPRSWNIRPYYIYRGARVVTFVKLCDSRSFATSVRIRVAISVKRVRPTRRVGTPLIIRDVFTRRLIVVLSATLKGRKHDGRFLSAKELHRGI